MRIESTGTNQRYQDSIQGDHSQPVQTKSTAADKQQSQQQDKKEISEKEVIKAIEQANSSLVMPQTMFEFSIHEKTHEIMVKVINEQTGEVIREIPPEKILDMVAKMWEMAGILLDEKV